MNRIEQIGNKIRMRRNFLKISQNELAGLSGISVRSIKDIEGGKGNPGLIQLIKLLDVLGMEINIAVNKE